MLCYDVNPSQTLDVYIFVVKYCILTVHSRYYYSMSVSWSHVPHPLESLYLQIHSTEPGVFLHSNLAFWQVDRSAHSSMSATARRTAENIC